MADDEKPPADSGNPPASDSAEPQPPPQPERPKPDMLKSVHGSEGRDGRRSGGGEPEPPRRKSRE